MTGSKVYVAAMLTSVAIVTAPSWAGVEVTESAAGASPAAIQTSVDAYRALLGDNNGVGGAFPSGRREINWDGVPDAFSAPSPLPADFFNVRSARGVVFSTGGIGFQVSAKEPSGTAVRFGNLNSTYVNAFQTFSPERLFVQLGSNHMDVEFFLPGTRVPASVTAFGAVFADVDGAEQPCTGVQLFSGPVSLGVFCAPAADQGLSFLGLRTTGEDVITRVRLFTGSDAIGASEGYGSDMVVMDDFIYSEPQPLTPGVVPAQWVPVVSRAAGAAGSQWRTDLGLTSRSAGDSTAELHLHQGTQVTTDTVTLAPGEQLILADVVGALGQSGSGALEVVASAPVAVTSRTFNLSSGGTFGQSLDATTTAAALGAGQSALLSQLVENTAFRTNIAVTNTGPVEATVAVDLSNADGSLLTTYTVTVAPGQWLQESRAFSTRAGRTDIDSGYARVTVQSGQGVVAYASVVDNLTNDPTTVNMLR